MSIANVNDRSSVERLYPREAFEADAARNSRGKALVLEGVLIASQPSPSGEFELQRKRHHIGENDPEGDTLFLAPYLGEEYAALQETPDYGGAEEKAGGLGAVERGSDYAAFIGRIVETAKQAKFKSPIGNKEERLRGFHGG
jgi:hypothetical protein